MEFLQWLTVEPGELENVGAQLAKQGSTRYVSATTGRFNLCLHGVLPGYGDLYHYMTAVVGALPGVHAADMTLQARTLKRAWVPIGDDGPTTGSDRDDRAGAMAVGRAHVARARRPRAGRCPPGAAAVAGRRPGGRGDLVRPRPRDHPAAGR